MAELAQVTLLRPVRVLVAGEDSEIVGHLRDELLRLGFQATSTTHPSRATELAVSERVNVAILDTSGGLAATASIASALEALPQRVRVVLAGRRGMRRSNLGYDVVDPAVTGEDLSIAVHRAYRGDADEVGRSSRR
jgi:hypothetical protein